MTGAPSPDDALLPALDRSELVVSPPGDGVGAWAGGPSALVDDGTIYLAYRLRRPIGEGRGYCNVVASSRDGVGLEQLAVVRREQLGAESLERPALVRTAEGRWRLYVSCATPGTKHWRVVLLEAATPVELPAAEAVTVLPGSDREGVKDPVLLYDGGRWHLWASVHPLERWDDADRMTTHYATSADGIDWTWRGMVLAGRPGGWDARGVRVSSVRVRGDDLLVTYDGRATADENWEEVTGVAVGRRGADGSFGRLQAVAGPVRSPYGFGALRYLTSVEVASGARRWYFEMARADGAHELRTALV